MADGERMADAERSIGFAAFVIDPRPAVLGPRSSAIRHRERIDGTGR
jgi:hypothetical protein